MFNQFLTSLNEMRACPETAKTLQLQEHLPIYFQITHYIFVVETHKRPVLVTFLVPVVCNKMFFFRKKDFILAYG